MGKYVIEEVGEHDAFASAAIVGAVIEADNIETWGEEVEETSPGRAGWQHGDARFVNAFGPFDAGEWTIFHQVKLRPVDE